MKKDLEKYLQEAITNIHEDRKVTKDLLRDVLRFLAADDKSHEKVGQVAAKYVETLQRSNEQLVKVSAIINKQNKYFKYKYIKYTFISYHHHFFFLSNFVDLLNSSLDTTVSEKTSS